MNTINTLIGLCLFAAAPVLANNSERPNTYQNVSDELEVISNVLSTTFRQNYQENGWRIGQLQSSYLAGQGALITVSIGGQSRVWIEQIEGLVTNLPQPPMPPKPPIELESGGIQFTIDEEWEEAVVEASRHISDMFTSNTDQLRDLRSEQRELGWQKRELEREIRNIEFSLRQTDSEDRQAFEEEIAQLRASIEAAVARETQLKERINEIAQEQQVRLQERENRQQQAYTGFLANFEASVGSTLCRFGSGLRALPNNEHVNVIVKGIEVSEEGIKQDRIYVFAKSDIKSCVQEHIDESTLLSNATVYVF